MNKVNQTIVRHIFKYPKWVNTEYMSNMILISDLDIGIKNSDTVDVVICKNGEVVIFDEFSEYIDSKLAGGWLYKGVEKGDKLVLISYTGEVFKPPEWNITYWMYGEDEFSIDIKDKQENWFTIGEKTNYKIIPESEMEI